MKIFAVWIALVGVLFAKMESITIFPKDYNQTVTSKVTFLDVKDLSFGHIGWQQFYGISALAYDKDTDMLYMLSDRSRLFKFKFVIKKDKIITLKPLWAHRLRDKKGRKFFIKRSDSEGMTLVRKEGQKVLLISFEQQPKVMAFDLEGREITGRYATLTRLPKILQKVKSYRAKNTMLESITYTKKFGVIVTPEYPLAKKALADPHSLYNQKGEICKIRKTNPYGAITELETMPDGNLLALQREFDPATFDIIISLQKIYLNHQKKGFCQTEDLINMTNKQGWELDNFEGLTYLGNGLYLMISDDNGNIFQKTLLVLFHLS